MLLLGLWTAPEPVRIGIAVLLVSRRRPLINLLAYWLGGMAAGMGIGLVALTLFRDSMPALIHPMTSTFVSFTGGHVRAVIGVLALSIAAVSARGLVRRRAHVPLCSDGPPTPAPQPRISTAFSRLVAPAWRLLEGGRPWVSFVAGLPQATPWGVEYVMALSAIAASGAAFGTQLCAVAVFTVVVFAFVEIPLVCYLVSPARTETIVLSMHDWLQSHRRQILVVGAGVLGVVMVFSDLVGI
ncbi:MAG: GAP family protein [Mycobacterium sp.]